MTEREKLMHEIMGSISGSDAPLVFKGGLITKLLLSEQGFYEIERLTKDIDASWVSGRPDISVIVNTINRCVSKLNDQYTAVSYKGYGETTAADIRIIDKSTGDEIISMDIDVKSPLGSKEYFFGETSIRGVLPDEILADKISALSGRAVFKRSKDLVDIFALSHCIDISTKNICSAAEKLGRVFGDFSEFLTRKADVEHSYNKLVVLKGKPTFAELYPYMNSFFKPFIEKDFTIEKIWNSGAASWEPAKEQSRERKALTWNDWQAQIARERQKADPEPDAKARTAQDRDERGVLTVRKEK